MALFCTEKQRSKLEGDLLSFYESKVSPIFVLPMLSLVKTLGGEISVVVRSSTLTLVSASVIVSDGGAQAAKDNIRAVSSPVIWYELEYKVIIIFPIFQ